MKAHREIEHKYEVAADSSLPDLSRLRKVATVEPPIEHALEAVYFDTEKHDLTRAGVTLRRRTGGADDGWHLKLPVAASEREEIRRPIRKGAAETAIPTALLSLVQVHARGRALKPVANLRSSRVVHRLRAKDGTTLADFCDDNVAAEVMHGDGSVTTSAWREWELELVEGPPKLLRTADQFFLDAGVSPSRPGSKLARALAATDRDPSERVALKPSAKGPAGLVVLAHLREHVDKLKTLDPRVRRDLPDALHAMRVSTRRLRSGLTSFKPLLDAEQCDAIRNELKWLAGMLGEARDAEVMRDRLTAMASEDTLANGSSKAEPAEPAEHGGIAAELAAELGARYRAAHKGVLRVLDSPRYFRLLDALDSLLSSPPWTRTAEERAREALPRLIRRDWRRVRRHAAAADHAADADQRDLELHEVRKAAKRLRYGCEGLAPVFGVPAARLGVAAKNLQEVLGEHQDSVVSQNLLRELAGQDGVTGDSALTLGRLHLIEQEHAGRASGHYDAAWKEVSDKRLRRWLKS